MGSYASVAVRDATGAITGYQSTSTGQIVEGVAPNSAAYNNILAQAAAQRYNTVSSGGTYAQPASVYTPPADPNPTSAAGIARLVASTGGGTLEYGVGQQAAAEGWTGSSKVITAPTYESTMVPTRDLSYAASIGVELPNKEVYYPSGRGEKTRLEGTTYLNPSSGEMTTFSKVYDQYGKVRNIKNISGGAGAYGAQSGEITFKPMGAVVRNQGGDINKELSPVDYNKILANPKDYSRGGEAYYGMIMPLDEKHKLQTSQTVTPGYGSSEWWKQAVEARSRPDLASLDVKTGGSKSSDVSKTVMREFGSYGNQIGIMDYPKGTNAANYMPRGTENYIKGTTYSKDFELKDYGYNFGSGAADRRTAAGGYVDTTPKEILGKILTFVPPTQASGKVFGDLTSEYKMVANPNYKAPDATVAAKPTSPTLYGDAAYTKISGMQPVPKPTSDASLPGVVGLLITNPLTTPLVPIAAGASAVGSSGILGNIANSAAKFYTPEKQPSAPLFPSVDLGNVVTTAGKFYTPEKQPRGKLFPEVNMSNVVGAGAATLEKAGQITRLFPPMILAAAPAAKLTPASSNVKAYLPDKTVDGVYDSYRGSKPFVSTSINNSHAGGADFGISPQKAVPLSNQKEQSNEFSGFLPNIPEDKAKAWLVDAKSHPLQSVAGALGAGAVGVRDTGYGVTAYTVNGITDIATGGRFRIFAPNTEVIKGEQPKFTTTTTKTISGGNQTISDMGSWLDTNSASLEKEKSNLNIYDVSAVDAFNKKIDVYNTKKDTYLEMQKQNPIIETTTTINTPIAGTGTPDKTYEYGGWSRFAEGSGRVARAALGFNEKQLEAYGETLKSKPGIRGDMERVVYGAGKFISTEPANLAPAAIQGAAFMSGGEVLGAGVGALAGGTGKASQVASWLMSPTGQTVAKAGVATWLGVAYASGVTERGTATKEQTEMNIGSSFPGLLAMSGGAGGLNWLGETKVVNVNGVRGVEISGQSFVGGRNKEGVVSVGVGSPKDFSAFTFATKKNVASATPSRAEPMRVLSKGDFADVYPASPMEARGAPTAKSFGQKLTKEEAMDYVKNRYPEQGAIWDRYMTDVQKINAKKPPTADEAYDRLLAKYTDVFAQETAMGMKPAKVYDAGRYPSSPISSSVFATKERIARRSLGAGDRPGNVHGASPTRKEAEMQLLDYNPTGKLTEISTERKSEPKKQTAGGVGNVKSAVKFFEEKKLTEQLNPRDVALGLTKFRTPKAKETGVVAKEKWKEQRTIEKEKEWVAARTGLVGLEKTPLGMAGKAKSSAWNQRGGSGGGGGSPTTPRSGSVSFGGGSGLPALKQDLSMKPPTVFPTRAEQMRARAIEEEQLYEYSGRTVPGMTRPKAEPSVATDMVVRELNDSGFGLERLQGQDSRLSQAERGRQLAAQKSKSGVKSEIASVVQSESRSRALSVGVGREVNSISKSNSFFKGSTTSVVNRERRTSVEKPTGRSREISRTRSREGVASDVRSRTDIIATTKMPPRATAITKSVPSTWTDVLSKPTITPKPQTRVIPDIKPIPPIVPIIPIVPKLPNLPGGGSSSGAPGVNRGKHAMREIIAIRSNLDEMFGGAPSRRKRR